MTSQYVKSFIISIIFVVILPNSAFIGLAFWLDLSRPLINFDYLIVSILILSGLRLHGILLFSFLFTIDLIALAGQVFLFIRFDNLLYLAKFIPSTSIVYQIIFICILFLLFTLSFTYYHLAKFTTSLHTLIILNISLIFYAINAYSQGDEHERIWRVQTSPIVASQFFFVFDKRSEGLLQNFNGKGTALSNRKVLSATQDLFNINKKPENNKLFLIISESWGIPHNSDIQRELLSPLINLIGYLSDFSEGTLDFGGPTVAAELRELCQIYPLHYNFKNTIVGFENCLPNLLQKQGFKTHAMHGATGVMYDRIYWYPRAGLSNFTFFETKSWPRRCYSFPGACDIDMIDTASQILSSSTPTFLYWLTLNSHSIYDPRDIHIDVFDCEKFNISSSTQSCRNFKLHAQFFYSLADSISRGKFHDVEIIIVGDHDPVITNLEEKRSNFVEEMVPWIRFKIH